MLLWLNLVFSKKQRFGKHINGWNQTNKYEKLDFLFLQWSNWSQKFWCKVVKNWQKKYFNEIDIYYIAYVTVKKVDNCKNINSVNPLHFMIDEMIGHFQEKNETKSLVLDDVDENNEV